MEDTTKTARANPKPPDVDQPQEVIRYLLDIELKRLATATRIEDERNIVFPETTVIIRDILKLLNAIDHHPDSTDFNDEMDKAIKALDFNF